MKNRWIQRIWIPTCLVLAVTAGLSIGFLILFPRDPAVSLGAKLADGDIKTRYKATKELEELGANAAGAVEPLAKALSDVDPKVRYRAAKTLSKLGENVAEAVPALAAALKGSRSRYTLLLR